MGKEKPGITKDASKAKKNTGSMHKGHRARMRARIQNGLSQAPPHEVLEVLLYQCISRRDVNELAHCLIDRFGSVREVVFADGEALMEVEGINKRCVTYFQRLRMLIGAYENMSISDWPHLNKAEDALRYIQRTLARSNSAQTWMFLLTKTGRLILKIPISRQEFMEEVPNRRIAEATLTNHVNSVMLARWDQSSHNEPDEREMQFARQLSAWLRTENIMFSGSILVNERRATVFASENPYLFSSSVYKW